MDRVDADVRSRIMSGIRGRDTGPELAVRRALHTAGLRFRLYRNDLPGTPDVVLPRYGIAVFVNGCFWHRCPRCGPSTPKSNVEFWERKFRRNVERDARNVRDLEALGWRVAVVWECRIEEGVGLVLSLVGGRDV